MNFFNKIVFQQNTLENEDLQKRLIEIYVEENKQRITDLISFSKDGNTNELCRVFHTIKSSSAYLGLSSISESTKLLEKACIKGSVCEDIQKDINQLLEDLKSSEKELINYLKELESAH